MRKLIIPAVLLLSACSLAPKFNPPKIETPAAFKEEAVAKDAAWKTATPAAGEDRGAWWKIYDDKKLNALEEEAAGASPTLQAAAARVEQARAQARATDIGFLPSVDLGANAVRHKPSGAVSGSSSTEIANTYTAGGVVSYEPDLLSRVRDETRAEKLEAKAADAAYKSVLLALQADVAQNYFTLRALDSERRLLRDTVAVRREAARIMYKRVKEGVAGEQDSSRAQAELDAARADLTALDIRRAASEHALAVLLGKLPSSFTFPETPLKGLPPQIPPGLPSALLERRPDIAAATDEMAAANQRIGAARAAFFPSLILTASGGYESSALKNLFEWSAHTWALGQAGALALTLPIFDSGRRSARLDQARAAYDESVANYRQQVLVAFREVEDNLSAQHLLAAQTKQLDSAASAAERTFQLAQVRYNEGETEYFDVVDAQRSALAARRAAVQARGQRYAVSVTLIRALGGGW